MWSLILVSLIYVLIMIISSNYKRTVLTRAVDGRFVPYLVRHTLFTCKYFSIKLHHVLISDEAELHNHPWNYISIILWGGYYEERAIHNSTDETTMHKIKTWFPPLSIIKRKGDIAHRLILKDNKPCWSLIFTSKKYREWGYVKSTLEDSTEGINVDSPEQEDNIIFPYQQNYWV